MEQSNKQMDNKRKSVFDDIEVLNKKLKGMDMISDDIPKTDDLCVYRVSNPDVAPGWVKLSKYNGSTLREEHDVDETDRQTKNQDLWHRSNIMYSYLIEKQNSRDKVNDSLGIQSPYWDMPHLLEPDPDAEYETDEECEESEEEPEDEDYESDNSELDQDFI